MHVIGSGINADDGVAAAVKQTIDYRGGPAGGDTRYVRRDLLLDPYDVVLPVKHRLAQRRTIKMGDLKEEPWILGASSGPCGEVTRAACTSAGFSPDIRHHVNEWAAVFTLVAAHQGVALAPRLATDVRHQGIVLRPLGGAAPSRNIYAAVRAGSERSPALKTVLDALEKAARDVKRQSAV